jgi:predicted lysophospholipase L1 biosynthesis ABC-type transport system permease subunit
MAQTEHLLDELKERAGIRRQIVLPWKKAFSMCKSNIFVRLGRSTITAMGIFLGIAFLASVLVSSSIQAAAAKQMKDVVEVGASGAVSGADSARLVWLVVMSLVVATIGIVNSMLMAVTERYKEIGTMKCLGALDSLIVRLFLLESGLLGMLGALIGMFIGAGTMILVQTLRHGWATVLQAEPVWGGVPLWGALLLTIPLGGFLSVLAALYPAWRAARMPPAAALRSEF